MLGRMFFHLLGLCTLPALFFAGGCTADSDAPRETREAAGAKPYEQFFLQRGYPEETFPLSGYLQAMEASRRQSLLRANPPAGLSDSWDSVTPQNFSGRVNTVAVHPQNESVIYAGLASGGAFKTTDGGQHWMPIFDQQAYLSIGQITLDPSNPETVYVGTGDPNVTGYPFIGDGLYKSTNGGASWSYIGLKETRIISSIVVHPTKPNTIWVGAMGLPFERTADRGVYKTTDGGATWKKALFVSNQAGVTDLVIDPFNPNILYAAFWDRIRNNKESIISGPNAKIYKSEDGGETWAALGGGLPASANLGRIALAVSGVTPGKVFARYVGSDQELDNIYRTDNAGQTWTGIIDFKIANMGRTTALGGSKFGWYFGKMAVNPENDFEIYLLGVELWRTRDGGRTWEMAAPSWRKYEVHADKHDLVFAKSGNVFLATDGGLFSKASAAETWSRVGALPGVQFFRIGYNPHKPEVFYGGAQDNGTIVGEPGKPWQRLFEFDGFSMQFSPEDPQVVYVQIQYGDKYVSLDGGTNWLNGSLGIPESDRANWDAPFIYSAHRPNLMYTGTFKVYKSTQSKIPNWYAISGDLTDGVIYGDAFHTVTALAESPRDSLLLYAGTSDGNLWRSTIGGFSQWTPVQAGLPDRYVTSIQASPNFREWVYTSFSGYRDNEFLPHIYRSKNMGASWENLTGDLPPVGVNDLLIVPGHRDTILFAATDAGVYATVNAGKNWYRLGANLPIVASYDLSWNIEGHQLVVGSFGRSMYAYDLEPLVPRTTVASRDRRKSRAPSIRVFPVPTSGDVQITYEEIPSRVAELRVYDASGKMLQRRAIDPKGKQTDVNLSLLPRGTYILSLNWLGGGISQQVIRL